VRMLCRPMFRELFHNSFKKSRLCSGLSIQIQTWRRQTDAAPYVASENDLFPTLRLTKEKRELRQEINQQRAQSSEYKLGLDLHGKTLCSSGESEV